MQPSMTTRVVWSPDEYVRHRIPGIFVTSRSTVLIYTEARRDASDWAHMDILLQRSEDGGKSFGEPIILACGTEQYKTVNNPVIMEDKNGRLHLLHCKDYTIGGGGAWHRYSDDDGKTWSEPREITEATRPEIHDVFAFGPGHGITLSDGTLLVPVWMVPKGAGESIEKHWPSVISTFYSKDNGESWTLGEIIPSTEEVPNPNETAAVELDDGRVMLDIRSFAHIRSLSYSANGYSDWSEAKNHAQLVDPSCFGSIASITAEDGHKRLLSVNCDNVEKRVNVVIKVSDDNGETWGVKRTVDAERGGYCDIAVDGANGKIYVLYEEKYGKYMFLSTIDKEWLEI